jgi:tetratricopeptide (TPR) repeat protein
MATVFVSSFSSPTLARRRLCDGPLRGPNNLIEIQERVARTIAEKLELELTTDPGAPRPAGRLQNLHAYECYHRAMHELSRFTEEGLACAMQHVRNGLDLVGENELLLATMAYVYIQYLELGLKPEPRYLEQAEEYANRALLVCSESCLGHVARGMVHFKRGDIELAVPDLKRALQTDPTDRDALFWLALIYLIAGREPAAEPLLDRLLEIDPLTAVNHCLPGYAEFLRGKIEDAIPAYRRMLQLDPASPVTRWFLTLVLARCGRDTEAQQLLDDLIRGTPYTTFARHAQFLSAALRRDRDAALAAVTPQLLAEARWDQHASWWMASAYALIDEREAALDWLRNATRLGYINYPFLSQHDPFLDSLRVDGRFWVLMHEVKGRWERFVP